MLLLIPVGSIWNQADKLVLDFHQEEQHILIIRLSNSIFIIDDNFRHKKGVHLFLCEDYEILMIISLMPIAMVITTIVMIYLIKLVVKWTYRLLDRVSDIKKELASKVIVTPALTLESNLKGSVTSELCTEKK
ncbi:Protein of unknown function [Cotesia congregata]|uniref:Uncharacterized protein n=1 Tax=Cotesia congregata TaxID=51543 RepID=A0A8J2HKD0_COTCN|nr:Protein of unknown function [Cotesia congregata]